MSTTTAATTSGTSTTAAGTTSGTSTTAAGTTSGTSTATTTTGAASATGDTTAVVVPDTSAEVLTPSVYGIFATLFVLILTIFVLFSTGSILSVLVLWATIALVLMVLNYYGFLNLEKIAGSPKRQEAAPRPSGVGGPMVGSEVFHISQNAFTYDEAPAVCAAYGAELATLEQIIEAYNGGAEWCGYGWSAGGMALYPTQKKTWDELQREVDPGKRTACGRPGVNGGYFDPTLKFGVNCFGFKPPGEFTPPAPLPGTNREEFDRMVARFRELIKSFQLSPFSRTEWSGYDSTAVGQARAVGRRLTEGFTTMRGGYGSQFRQDLGGLVVEHYSGAADPAYTEAANTVAAYNANGPYGLRGDIGPTGPAGVAGAAGAAGQAGPAGQDGAPGVPGPTGPRGTPGTPGTQGSQGNPGPTGPRGMTGPPGGGGAGSMGPTGPQGPAGRDGAMGPTGPRGTDGTPGRDGTNGRDGVNGRDGAMGPTGPPGSAAASKTFSGTVKFDYSPGESKIGRRIMISNPNITMNTTFTFSLRQTGDASWMRDRSLPLEPYIVSLNAGRAEVVQTMSTQYGAYDFNWTAINP